MKYKDQQSIEINNDATVWFLLEMEWNQHLCDEGLAHSPQQWLDFTDTDKENYWIRQHKWKVEYLKGNYNETLVNKFCKYKHRNELGGKDESK